MRLNSSGVVGQRGDPKTSLRGWEKENKRVLVIEEKWPGGSVFRTEEPLKGYRQWVLDGLCESFKKSLK